MFPQTFAGCVCLTAHLASRYPSKWMREIIILFEYSGVTPHFTKHLPCSNYLLITLFALNTSLSSLCATSIDVDSCLSKSYKLNYADKIFLSLILELGSLSAFPHNIALGRLSCIRIDALWCNSLFLITWTWVLYAYLK